MMTIVIVGAGDIGLYIAALLSKEEHNIILIDTDDKKLEQAARQLDVGTRRGSGTDWQLLDNLLEHTPQLIIALTDSDETNMVVCSLAKHLGYPRTIARVRYSYFLNKTRLDFSRLFNIDYFIGPEQLVAHEILKFILHPGSIQMENFVQGAVQLRTITVPVSWDKGAIPLKRLSFPSGAILGLIRRLKERNESRLVNKYEVIFPHGEDVILPLDEVTLIGETLVISEIHHFFGIPSQTVRNITLVGGSLTAVHLARLLEYSDIQVRILEKSYERCSRLADLLPHCTITHADAADLEFLQAEKIGDSELVVACTRHDETNILAAMLAQEVGCQNALVVLNNTNYTELLTKLGINYAFSPRVSAANHILAQLFAGSINSLVSLYDNQAEVIEINISADSEVIGIPLAELGPLLPKDLLIAMIQNRGRILSANGNRVISPGDTVIAIMHPRHAANLERIF